MKVIEILNFNRELLKRLQAAGIRLEDARYIDLYADYTRLLDQGEKVSYAVAVLSEKYSVSERKDIIPCLPQRTDALTWFTIPNSMTGRWDIRFVCTNCS